MYSRISEETLQIPAAQAALPDPLKQHESRECRGRRWRGENSPCPGAGSRASKRRKDFPIRMVIPVLQRCVHPGVVCPSWGCVSILVPCVHPSQSSVCPWSIRAIPGSRNCLLPLLSVSITRTLLHAKCSCPVAAAAVQGSFQTLL